MIKLIVLDVDGTLTDGKIYLGNNGKEFKAFDIKDGMGIATSIKEKNIIFAIITGRSSAIVERRSNELGIQYLFQGVSNKLDKLKNFIDDIGITPECVAYIGDDINDMECIQYLNNHKGYTACPLDAVDKVKNAVSYISSYKGGNGAVRDIIEHII